MLDLQSCIEQLVPHYPGQIALVDRFGVQHVAQFTGDSESARYPRVDDLFALYCTGKPIVAMALAAAVTDGVIEYGTRVGECLGGLDGDLAVISVADLLGHRAGLEFPSAASTFGSPVTLERLKPHLRISKTFGTSSYSEANGWHLLALVLDAVDHAGWRGRCQALLSAWGLSAELQFGPVPDSRLAVHTMRHSERIYELSIERWFASHERDAAVGAFGTARGLAMLYHRFNGALVRGSSEISQGAASFLVASADSERYHHTLGRRCTLGYGFFLDLQRHEICLRASRESFGHCGGDGSSAALFEPVHHVAVAINLGALDRVDGSEHRRTEVVRERRRLMDAVLDAYAKGGRSGSPSRVLKGE